jgi:hydroxymethylglutaryl-CoA lyase
MQEILIHEVGLRDGLQVEKGTVPLEEKIRWVEGLFASGVDIIQLGSFVHPGKVPQMADTDELFQQVAKRKPAHVTLSGLVLNEKGMQRGFACGVEMFCMGVSASDTHSLKNTGNTIKEAHRQIIAMASLAMAAGRKVQVSVQSAFGCGFEGPVPQSRVLDLVKSYLDNDVRTISLADTAGYALPQQVEEMFGAIRNLDPTVELACHFHNTYGMGLANCYTALQSGVSFFESSFGGLGGCPFTKVPAGNVATEDLVHTFQRMGLRTDIRLDVLIDMARQVSTYFARELPGLIQKSGSIVETKGQPA